MAKFNKSADTIKSTNKAGGIAYDRTVKQQIATIVLNSMLNGKDSYYETELEKLANIENICSKPELAEFIAKTMVYARTVGNLRNISHFLAIILAENVKGTNYLRPAFKKAFIRPDDLTETLALWNSRHSYMVPNALRRAFKDVLEGFDKYQLKKYSGDNQKVKLRDVVIMSHPTPNEKFKELIEGTLSNIQTAQTINASSIGEKRAENYKILLQNKKLGYMAALKNIKNIIEANTDLETINMLCKLIRNEKACLNSKVLPFRFVQAFEIVDSMNIDRILAKKLIKAIEDGFIISAKNIPIVENDEKVAILLDESGSMGDHKGSPFMIGKTLMASMLTGLDKNNVVGYLWADSAREINVESNPFHFIKNIQTKGGGADVWSAMKGLINSGTYVDKIVIFTDMQLYDCDMYSCCRSKNRKFQDVLDEYKSINPNVKVVFWNLENYSTGTPIQLNNSIMEVAGFSDKMLEVVAKMLKYSDKDYLVKEIEAIQL